MDTTYVWTGPFITFVSDTVCVVYSIFHWNGLSFLWSHDVFIFWALVIICATWTRVLHRSFTNVIPPLLQLTYLPSVPHICVSDLVHHCFRQWLVFCLASSHYLNQCWFIANRTLRNKFQRHLIKIQNSSFTKTYLEMSSAKWRPCCPGWRGDQLIHRPLKIW